MRVNYISEWVEFGFVKTLSQFIHSMNVEAGWWDGDNGKKLTAEERVVTCIALIHSEISEALEGARKGKMDDHLPNRKAVEVELADAMIRILDLAGAYDFDLGSAMKEKLMYNATRADHKKESRTAPGGKKF